LQLTLPTAYRATILRRLLVTTALSGGLAVAVTTALVASGWWHRWPGVHSPLAGQLTWLAPTLFLAGLGLLAGAASGSPAVATSVVGVVWIFAQVVAATMQDHRWARLLNLFATTRGRIDADWTPNRLTLLAAGAGMAVAGWLLLRRPIRLLTRETE
jgi:hypothetical protein